MRGIFLILGLAALACLGLATGAPASTEVKMVGDARVYGVFFANRNFTGWNAGEWTSNTPDWRRPGTRTEDRFQIWQRFRLRSDFVANEAVKFRLGIKVEDVWGHGTLTAANPQVAVEVYQAFLQFKLPVDTPVEVTAGLQSLSLPQSRIFNGSILFDEEAAAIVLNATLIQDVLALKLGMSRMLDTNRSYDTTTTQVDDELDLYFLALPVTLEGFAITPWSAVGVVGKRSGMFTANFAQNLLSAGTFSSPAGWRNQQNAYWWAGGAIEVTALDPVKFYADVIYGQGAMSDRMKNSRAGWFIDGAVEYTGLAEVTPQVFGWWSTGEDASTSNGSERMPSIYGSFNAGNSFLFDGGQVFGKESNMGVNPAGTWAIGASLNNISLMERLSQRLTFVYVRGQNDPSSARALNALVGSNPYYSMGRDLMTDEYILGLNFDNQYNIYDNLALVMETGWASGVFKESVWGQRLVKASRNGDAWKAALGLSYKF